MSDRRSTESLRQKDRAGMRFYCVCIPIFRAAGFGSIFYFKEEIPCRHFLMRLYGKQHELHKANSFKAAKQELDKNKKRIVALDKLIEAAFEKNVLGTLRDDLFERMTANYEKEQRELIQAVAETERQLANAEQDNIDLRAFLSIIRKCTDLKELTPELVNRLITKIEVFDSTKDENGKKHVPIKVHFIGVGVIVIPDGKTILETYEEIRKNPPRVA